jgi:ribosomal protein S18 acetylase RimI-like enzyme
VGRPQNHFSTIMVAARGQAVLCQNQGKQQPQECDKGKKALIRRATESDIPRITDIRNNVRENKLIDPRRVTIEDVRWFISNPGIFLGEEDGRVVGFSAADPRNGNIWALFLDQAYEGRGIARALLQQACAVLSEAGFQQMWLTTDPGTRAEAFYRAAGWQVVGHRGSELPFTRQNSQTHPRPGTPRPCHATLSARS